MKDIRNLLSYIAPLFKVDPVRDQLSRKWRECYTLDGRKTVEEAMALHRRFPKLSTTELIRLAYWGSSGESEE